MIALPVKADLFNAMSNVDLEMFRPGNPGNETYTGTLFKSFLEEANLIAKNIALGEITNAQDLNERQKFMLCAAMMVPYEIVCELGDETKGETHGRVHFRLTRPMGLIIKNRRLLIQAIKPREKP